jgi:DnaD/phage-associated family protein
VSRTILADVDGFTPVIDALVQDVGLMSAIVFGRVWRYCQMKEQLCTASMEKIGEGIGIDRLTVLRHLRELCERGYLEDRTPGIRNRPHIYADTGKAGLQLSLSGVSESNTKKGVSQNNTGVSENNSAVAQSNSTVSESNMKREVKKQAKKEVKKEKPTGTAAASQSLLIAYKSSIGQLTPMMLRTLANAESLYPSDWIIEALQVAAENNVKKWSYADAILKRWTRDGKVDNKHNGNGEHKTTWGDVVDAEESPEELEQIAAKGRELRARIAANLAAAESRKKELEEARR